MTGEATDHHSRVDSAVGVDQARVDIAVVPGQRYGGHEKAEHSVRTRSYHRKETQSPMDEDRPTNDEPREARRHSVKFFFVIYGTMVVGASLTTLIYAYGYRDFIRWAESTSAGRAVDAVAFLSMEFLLWIPLFLVVIGGSFVLLCAVARVVIPSTRRAGLLDFTHPEDLGVFDCPRCAHPRDPSRQLDACPECGTPY